MEILLILAPAVLFIWLAVRACHSRRWYVRWPGLILSGLLGLIFVVLAAGASRGLILMERIHANPASAIVAAPAVEALARGQVNANGCSTCSDCHGMKLDGVPSNALAPQASSPIALGKTWAHEQFVAVFRQGVLPGSAAVPEAMPRRVSDSLGLALEERMQPANVAVWLRSVEGK